MKRKKRDSKTKWMIILEGLKGKTVVEICAENNLSQSQYYKWRDQFFAEGYKVFDQVNDQNRTSLLVTDCLDSEHC